MVTTLKHTSVSGDVSASSLIPPCAGNSPELPGIGVGTGGARGGPRPPQYINQGGPGPPQCWSHQRYLTVKLDFFIHIPAIFCNNSLGSSTNFNFKNFYGDLCM